MFMINNYHMALINDNDFGLEGNTHVQIAIIQLANMIGLDDCMINPTCGEVLIFTRTSECGEYDPIHIRGR